MHIRRLFFIAMLALGVALAAPSASPAASRYKVGIGDQSATMLDHPAFRTLGIKRVRYLVPWDWTRNKGVEAEVRGYMTAMLNARKEVFVTFTATRGCWKNNRYLTTKRCQAPSTAAYTKSFRAFRKAFPTVNVYSPWNEANHASQPTARSPKRAAQYYNALRRYCKGCTIVAADLLDQSNAVGYLMSFRRYAKGSPRRWGLHNYSDVNRTRSSGTRALLRAAPGELWLTETGGVVTFGRSFPYSPKRAAARLKYMFELADTYSKRRRGMRSRITRIYPYAWTGVARTERFDAGLTYPNGKTRPGYKVFKSYLKTRST